MDNIRCAVVTGANKGIGFEICRQLALEGIEIILTARNESRGVEAVNKLNASGISNVIFHQLDITDSKSVQNLVKFIESRFKKLDILVNNAAESGIVCVDINKFKEGGAYMQVTDDNVDNLTGLIEEPYDLGERCLNINYYGTKRVTDALIPLLQLSKSPRVVNVSSVYGDLHWFPNEELKQELHDIENLTEERIDEVIQCFLKDFKVAKLRENRWPLTCSAIKVSKAALNAYTRLMARKFQNILINAVNPGYVVTDMSSQTGILTVEEGAKGLLMAALLPDDGPSGAYFDKTKLAPFTSVERPI
ncbi:hypothetical protein QVD17_04173 [Tagetes erecta]|uniref:Glucose/ribitol dehydrogenase n=1 Tax=Tagetes erecta TaxID=13708 RepID=A0AAD8L9Q3_TARER|nr:hypothetical protein QVD17_04173 [Tagetes erecta]